MSDKKLLGTVECGRQTLVQGRQTGQLSNVMQTLILGTWYYADRGTGPTDRYE